MELVLPQISLETASTPVTAARPGLVTDGANVLPWMQSGYQIPSFLGIVTPSQASTLNSPTGGANGPEVWSLVNGVWILVAYFLAKAGVPLPAGGYGETFRTFGMGTRLHIAGTPSVGTAAFQLIPVEYIAQLVQ